MLTKHAARRRKRGPRRRTRRFRRTAHDEEDDSEDAEDSEDSDDDDDDDDARVGADGLNAALRARSETNREAMEKGTRAFVSYMRGYKEHHCRFIFHGYKELQLATRPRAPVGLLRLPRMKEIRKAPKAATAGFEESAVDPDSVPYAEKAREKQRRAAAPQPPRARRGGGARRAERGKGGAREAQARGRRQGG